MHPQRRQAACRENERTTLLEPLLQPLAQRCALQDGFLEEDVLHTELIRCFAQRGELRRCVRIFAQLARVDVPLSAFCYGFTLKALRAAEASVESSEVKLLSDLSGNVMSLGVERGAFPQPLRWEGDGRAVIDLSSLTHASVLIAALHYALSRLSREVRSDGVALQSVQVLTDDSNQLATEIVSRELRSLRLAHRVVGDVELLGPRGAPISTHLDPTRLRPHVIEAMLGVRDLDAGVAVAGLEAAAGPAADELDATIDQLALGIAPRTTWLEVARRGQMRARRKSASRRPDDFDGPRARNAVSRWPTPRSDGAIPWSTPRPGDQRTRDNVLRAGRSRRRDD